MDPIDVIVDDVRDNAITYDVYRKSESGAYDGSFSKVGTVEAYVFSPSASSQVVTEGSGQETTLTGLVLPSYDNNGNLVHDVEVNDQLRPQSNTAKHYDVRVKNGLPDELDPDLWSLGIERANSSD